MLIRSLVRRVAMLLALAALFGHGLLMAQSEPTINQIYEAAQAGRMEQAQLMMQQVLVAHPNSAKAHFVQAELAARQGQMGRAREALATAEKLAPGLPFAKPQAVQELRGQLAAEGGAPVTTGKSSHATGVAAPGAPSSQFPWELALVLGAGVAVLAVFVLRKKPAPVPVATAAYGNQGAMSSGLTGPQGFGAAGGAGVPAYGQGPGSVQPAGSGLGGKVMGGLATGLAVGAGVMAAQAIGKSLMGNDENAKHASDGAAGNAYQPVAGNKDMGGQNFGVNDASSWDDGGSFASNDGGGDWDS